MDGKTKNRTLMTSETIRVDGQIAQRPRAGKSNVRLSVVRFSTRRSKGKSQIAAGPIFPPKQQAKETRESAFRAFVTILARHTGEW